MQIRGDPVFSLKSNLYPIPCFSDADPASRNDADPDTPHFSQLHTETSSSVTQTQQDSQTSTFCKGMCPLCGSEKTLHRKKSHYGTKHRSATIQCIPVPINVCKLKGGFLALFLFTDAIEHCFNCRHSDYTVGGCWIEGRTVATLALTARRSNHSGTVCKINIIPI